DGNILSWVYMFTIGLILYPIGRLAYFSFDSINLVTDIWLESNTLSIIIIITALLSLPIFKHIKKKQKETPTDN
ncbi:MAG: hypothetical protein IKJ86_05465, partial [Clostridia bacterium]|nr:hypothetical protein [Clostridia bacterium]